MGNILKGIDGERFPLIGGITEYRVAFADSVDIGIIEDNEILWQVYWANEYSEYEKVPFSGQKKGRLTTYKFLQNLQGKNLQLKATYKNETVELHITPQANGEIKIIDVFFLDVEYKIQDVTKLEYMNSVNLQIYTLNMLGKYVEFKIYDTVNEREVEVAKSSEPLKIVQTNGIVKTKRSILLSPAMYMQTQKDMSASEHRYKVKIWEKDNEANFYEEELKVKNKLGQMTVPQDSQTPVKTGTSEPEKKEGKKNDGKCFCDRDLTVDEFKKIISQMRDSEGILSKEVFTADNCTLREFDRTYEKLTEVYNKVLKKYDINTCTRKIHFFAQTYWEADRFKTTLEYSSGEYLNPGRHKDAILNGHTVDGDGPRYKGRGLMQLTWRKTYKEYFEYVVKNSPSLVNNKTVEELLNRKGIYSETYFYYELNKTTKKSVKKSKVYMVDSASLIGSNIDLAVDSAGWFWREYKKSKGKNLNDFSDYGDKYIDKISTLVNGGSNGKTNRKTYYENLRDNVFKIKEKCINYKNIKKV